MKPYKRALMAVAVSGAAIVALSAMAYASTPAGSCTVDGAGTTQWSDSSLQQFGCNPGTVCSDDGTAQWACSGFGAGGYSCTCAGSAGPTGSASLKASPATVVLGQPTTLTWAISGEPSGCAVSSNPPQGDWSGTKTNGTQSQSVTPNLGGLVTYSLSCSDGTKAAATVTVTGSGSSTCYLVEGTPCVQDGYILGHGGNPDQISCIQGQIGQYYSQTCTPSPNACMSTPNPNLPGQFVCNLNDDVTCTPVPSSNCTGAPPPPPPPTGSITVTSRNSQAPTQLVHASWSLSGPLTLTATGGTHVTYPTVTPGVYSFVSNSITATDQGYSFNSVELLPVAFNKNGGSLDTLLSLAKNLLPPVANAVTFGYSDPTAGNSSNCQTVTTSGPCQTANYVILWDPIAGMTVSPTTLSNSGTVTVTNNGTAGSKLTWTAVSDSPSWLSASPLSDATGLGSGASDSVTVTVNTALIAPGTTITGHVIFNGTSLPQGSFLPSSPTVTVTYTAPAAPPGTPVVTASGNPPTITQGGSTTITWTTTGTTNPGNPCTVSGVAGSFPANGSTSVSPSVTTTYTVTCAGPGSPGVSNPVKITVNPVAPVVITANPSGSQPINTPITYTATGGGAGGTYTWTTTAPGATPSPTTGGTTVITFPTSGSWTVTVTNSNGGSATVPVTITQPPQVSITASQTTITAGSSTVLTWGPTPTSGPVGSCTATGAWAGTAIGTSGSLNVSPPNTTTYGITCTGPGGPPAGGSQTITVNQPPPPPTSTVTGIIVSCTPNSIPTTSGTTCAATVVGTGGPSQGVTWTDTSDPTGGSIDSGSGAYTSGGTGGTVIVTATSDQDPTVSKSTTITVIAPPPPPPPPGPAPTVTITGPGNQQTVTITSGGSTTVTWSSSGTDPANPTPCVATGDWTNPSLPANGSQTVTPPGSGTYTYGITCTAAGGTQGSASPPVTVTVNNPPIVVTQTNPPPGGGTLPTVTNPITFTATGGNGVYTWTASGPATLPSGNTGSTFTVIYYTPGTYTATSTDSAGDAPGSITFTVNPVTPTCTFTASPSSIVVPQSSVLSWSCSNAQNGCSLNGVPVNGPSANGIAAGSQTVSPTASTTSYTLQCIGPGSGSGLGVYSSTQTVSVTGPGRQECPPGSPPSECTQ